MNDTSPMETPQQALEQVRFQLDLLRLTAVPQALRGPSVAPQAEQELEAVTILAELKNAAALVSSK